MTTVVIGVDALDAQPWTANLHIDVTDLDLHLTETHVREGAAVPAEFRVDRVTIPLRKGAGDFVVITSGRQLASDGALLEQHGFRMFLTLDEAPPQLATLIAAAGAELEAAARFLWSA